MNEPMEIVGLTHVGRVREQNEDAVGWDESIGLAVLADGVGGRNSGAVASRLAVDQIKSNLQAALASRDNAREPHDSRTAAKMLVDAAVHEVNSTIYRGSLVQPGCHGMATTVVVALFQFGCVTISHVGDSRLYRLRDRSLEQLTEDHSLVQELIQNGYLTASEAGHTTHRHVITRALGASREVEPEVQQHETKPGDVYLLCSDGLTNLVADHEIDATIRKHGDDLGVCAQQLVQQSNDRGGYDNVSVVLVAVG